MRKAIKRMIIEGTLLGAIGGFIVFDAGIEGTANIPACAAGMAICLAWMFIVAYANSEMIKRKRDD